MNAAAMRGRPPKPPPAEDMRLAAQRLRVVGGEMKTDRAEIRAHRDRLWGVANWLEKMADREEGGA